MKRLKKFAEKTTNISICVERSDNGNFIWIDLPIKKNDVWGYVREKLGITYEDENRDVYAEIVDVEGISFDLIQNYRLVDLNKYVGKYVELSENEQLIVDGLMYNGYNFEEALEKYEDYCLIDGETDTELGMNYVDLLGGLRELGEDTLKMFFDYESFGHDLYNDIDLEDEELKDFYEEMSYEEIAEDYIDNIGGVSNLSKDTLETYFDYDSFGYDLGFEDYLLQCDGYCIMQN